MLLPLPYRSRRPSKLMRVSKGLDLPGAIALIGLLALMSACAADTTAPDRLSFVEFPNHSGGSCLTGAATADSDTVLPLLLSETGCFVSLGDLRPASGVLAYRVQSPLWTDGALKRRFLALPAGRSITTSADGTWHFPIGTVLLKDFALQQIDQPHAQSVETRVMLQTASGWRFDTYEWNAAGDEATLLSARKVARFNIHHEGEQIEIKYLYPDRSQCRVCHRGERSQTLAVKPGQIGGMVEVAGTMHSQLDLWQTHGYLDAAVPPGSGWPDAGDTTASLNTRARGYLDANCAHCHFPGGFAEVSAGPDLDLRFETSLANSGMCDRIQFLFGVGEPRIDPGNPEGSWLLLRMGRLGAQRMPPVATELIDTGGEALLSRWIGALNDCPTSP